MCIEINFNIHVFSNLINNFLDIWLYCHLFIKNKNIRNYC
jgi:hypothetical protein